MSYKNKSWELTSTNGDTITFKMVDKQPQFEIFYDQPDDDEHGILFEVDDIPILQAILKEISEAK